MPDLSTCVTSIPFLINFPQLILLDFKEQNIFKGPLISTTNKKKILVGVMEMGKEQEGCIEESIVFHRVSPQAAWIMNNTGDSVECTIDPVPKDTKATSSGDYLFQFHEQLTKWTGNVVHLTCEV